MIALKRNKGILIFSVISLVPFIPVDLASTTNGFLIMLSTFKPVFVFPAFAWLLISPILVITKLLQFRKSIKEGNKDSTREVTVALLILVPFLIFVCSSVWIYGIDYLLTVPI